ncbi:hypothetical protein SRHO_G00179040 [Serrasalmus rhombeus]
MHEFFEPVQSRRAIWPEDRAAAVIYFQNSRIRILRGHDRSLPKNALSVKLVNEKVAERPFKQGCSGLHKVSRTAGRFRAELEVSTFFLPSFARAAALVATGADSDVGDDRFGSKRWLFEVNDRSWLFCFSTAEVPVLVLFLKNQRKA